MDWIALSPVVPPLRRFGDDGLDGRMVEFLTRSAPTLGPARPPAGGRLLERLTVAGLGRQGRAAVSALRRLCLPAWLRGLGPAAPGAWLDELDIAVVAPPAGIEGDTPSLAAALALLLAGTHSPHRRVIAAGALMPGDPDGTALAPASAPVLRRLLGVVAHWAEQAERGAAAVPVVLPADTRGDGPVVQALAPEIARLEALGLWVVTVPTLEAAAIALGATRLAAGWRDLTALGIGALAMAVLAGGLAA